MLMGFNCLKILSGLQWLDWQNLKLIGDLWDWVLGAACFTAAVAERAAQQKAKGAPPLHLVTPFALREHIHCVTRQRAIVESFRQNIQRPGDSKWPFDSLVGGHQQPLKGSLNHPKKVTSRIARGLWVEFDSWFHRWLGLHQTKPNLDGTQVESRERPCVTWRFLQVGCYSHEVWGLPGKWELDLSGRTRGG